MVQPTRLPTRRITMENESCIKFIARIPSDHDLETIEHPEYFQNYVNTFAGPLARGIVVRLEIISDNFNLHAEYLVTSASNTSVQMRRIAVHHDNDAEREAKRASGKYAASYDPVQNWSITFRPTKEVIASGMEKDFCYVILDDLLNGTMLPSEIPEEFAVQVDGRADDRKHAATKAMYDAADPLGPAPQSVVEGL